ncbi:MAG: DUF1232 domain-containing protein [Planctomycetes bacterium]|nr:DUF1232 domain-containing protein [Planctomycetota bacterium]
MYEGMDFMKPEDVRGVADRATSKCESLLGSAWEWVVLLAMRSGLLCQLLFDWLRGRYRPPWRTLAAAMSGLAYFIQSVDAVPDFIPVVGFADDAGVLGLVFRMIRADLLDYCRYRGLDPYGFGLEPDRMSFRPY